MNNIIDGLTSSTYIIFTIPNIAGIIEVTIAIVKHIDPIIADILSP